ncbi:hypothetical protein HK103_002914 [Boothiomyces macroporosus]|uniref:Uncharacterized protein n=1 Tax=Boothiomyces macroporosus TaxID=261099 RepID=A0AAD5UCY4_9FUNG|nr:hypothetical protein HK103_002914 [Boothiomyces macroporosus]
MQGLGPQTTLVGQVANDPTGSKSVRLIPGVLTPGTNTYTFIQTAVYDPDAKIVGGASPPIGSLPSTTSNSTTSAVAVTATTTAAKTSTTATTTTTTTTTAPAATTSSSADKGTVSLLLGGLLALFL